MKTGVLEFTLAACPVCQSRLIDEVSDAQGKVALCRDCGHTWSQVTQRIEVHYARFGFTVESVAGTPVEPECTPEERRAAEDYIRQAMDTFAWQASLSAFYGYPPAPAPAQRLPEPTPFQRGVLDRYQDKRRKR